MSTILIKIMEFSKVSDQINDKTMRTQKTPSFTSHNKQKSIVEKIVNIISNVFDYNGTIETYIYDSGTRAFD